VIAHECESESGAARDAAVVSRRDHEESIEDLFSFFEGDALPASSMLIASRPSWWVMRTATARQRNGGRCR